MPIVLKNYKTIFLRGTLNLGSIIMNFNQFCFSKCRTIIGSLVYNM